MRFQTVPIPQGATITTAYLTFRAKISTTVDDVNTRIRGEDADDTVTFSDLTDFDSRPRTTAQVDWDSIPDWTADTDYDTPEIKTVIQEIVDRAGWASGNSMVLFWDDFDDRSTHTSACYRQMMTYDHSSTYAPKLHIEYTEGVTEKTSSDSGAGADAYVSLQTPAAKLSSDAGSGVEGTPLPSAMLAGSESGYGVEASSVETDGLFKDLLASELGEGSDSIIAKIEMPTKGGGMKLWT